MVEAPLAETILFRGRSLHLLRKGGDGPGLI